MTNDILNFHKETAHIFATNLLQWFYKSKRALPFRETKDPYNIWISEIMAQQTQIDTLIPYYHRFVKAFPDVAALAKAPEDKVLKLWEGLGYYSRAKNLHKAAKIIHEEYKDVFPDHYDALVKLPGIGPYTGGAIASIAFKEKVPAIDGNVLRVISRFNNYNGDIADIKVKKVITDWVAQAMPDSPGDFNEGLMELGALICTPSSPKCMICPEQDICEAFREGTPNQLPVKSKKQRQKKLEMEVGIIDMGGSLYLVKRPDKGLLSGLWSFPIIEKKKDAPGHAIHQSLETVFPDLPEGKLIGNSKHVFSHIIWNMSVYYFEITSMMAAEAPGKYGNTEADFKDRDQLAAVALPTAFSKLLELL
ncbi:A/G-specific adenine glycosylase [Eubacterium sp. 1001713B170207_170306_E7]|uniref:A/G-specific adenine glycosylase n=1 Tax=Eubacterium sp. 1001713B170207_170306_E7 TaxID=2787097 RepID=UPI0018992EC0|nr:A/G-specific adenine glycosylase [Eubacterium sp. 1001713B170207_170306_E7]